jgi:hypothetical protein
VENGTAAMDAVAVLEPLVGTMMGIRVARTAAWKR